MSQKCVQCGRKVSELEFWMKKYNAICDDCYDKVESLKYGDKVKVVGGFYKGAKGRIKARIESGFYYRDDIVITTGRDEITVNEKFVVKI